MLANNTEVFYIAQTANFLIQIVISLSLIGPREYHSYAIGIGYTVMAATALYVALAETGHIEEVGGRYLYFNGLHPNLGSEIAATGLVVAALIMAFRPFIIFAGLAFISVQLMQGRAGMLVVIAVTALRIAFAFWPMFRRNLKLGVATVTICAPVVILVLFQPVVAVLSNQLLLDDEYRGIGTNLVGREDRWESALSVFLDNPLIGAGPGFFDNLGLETPHNFYLYAVSQFGVASFLIFAVLSYTVVRAFQVDRTTMIFISPIMILTIFNDRFMNANVYPMAIFILVFSIAVSPRARRVQDQSRTLRPC
jgi:O-antigen ligase